MSGKALLALDTAMQACAVGLCLPEGNQTYHQSKDLYRGHAEHLMPMIESVLQEAGATYGDLGGIGVIRGPGAFTGLRVGLSAARGLGLSLNIPVIGITAFDALYQGFKRLHEPDDRDVVLVLIETRRPEFFAALFNGNNDEPVCIDAEGLDRMIDNFDARKIYCIGDAAARYALERDIEKDIVFDDYFPAGCNLEDILTLTQQRIGNRKNYQKSFNHDPYYLRDADVSTPKVK